MEISLAMMCPPTSFSDHRAGAAENLFHPPKNLFQQYRSFSTDPTGFARWSTSASSRKADLKAGGGQKQKTRRGLLDAATRDGEPRTDQRGVAATPSFFCRLDDDVVY